MLVRRHKLEDNHHGTNRKITMDNWFTGLKLAEKHLLLFVVVAIRLNRAKKEL